MSHTKNKVIHSLNCTKLISGYRVTLFGPELENSFGGIIHYAATVHPRTADEKFQTGWIPKTLFDAAPSIEGVSGSPVNAEWEVHYIEPTDKKTGTFSVVADNVLEAVERATVKLGDHFNILSVSKI